VLARELATPLPALMKVSLREAALWMDTIRRVGPKQIM
jgi:hypothetical protein